MYKLEWVLYVLTQTWPEAGDGSKEAMKWRGIYIIIPHSLQFTSAL